MSFVRIQSYSLVVQACFSLRYTQRVSRQAWMELAAYKWLCS